VNACRLAPGGRIAIASQPRGDGVAFSRLLENHVGVVDAVHVPRRANPAAQLGDRATRAEADLQDAVGRLHVEQ